jgi:hypothetical protein
LLAVRSTRSLRADDVTTVDEAALSETPECIRTF